MSFLTKRPPNAKFLSIEQACKLAGICRRTIYNWIAADKVDYIRTAGGSIRIIEESLFRLGNKENE